MKCVCPPGSGYCSRHDRDMSEGLRALCLSDDGYYEAFQADLRKAQRKIDNSLSGPHEGSHCVHRGERDGTADCGCAGGRKKSPAYRCEVHGRCSDDDARGVAWCRWCQSFTARESAPSPD